MKSLPIVEALCALALVGAGVGFLLRRPQDPGPSRVPGYTYPGQTAHGHFGVSFLEGLPRQMDVCRDKAAIDANGNGVYEYTDFQSFIDLKEMRELGPTPVRGVFALEWCDHFAKLYLPEDSDGREKHWCAFVWRREMPACSYFVDSREKTVYVWLGSPRFGLQWVPEIHDAYLGEPFLSPLRPVWQPLNEVPK